MQADSLPAEPQGKPKNTGVGSRSLLQWIFLTQESNWGLPRCRHNLYQLNYQGSSNGAVRTFSGRLNLGNGLPRNFISPLYISKCSLSVQRAQYDSMLYTLVIYTFKKIKTFFSLMQLIQILFFFRGNLLKEKMNNRKPHKSKKA